jgi:ATP-dependent helicase/nuclease subunit A
MSRALDAANKNQRIAADPANSVFVTANAGSGKTKVLVDRIARLLLEGAKPSAFLCITYTKAAAAEMQRRLFERLGGWCVADDATLGGELEKLGAKSADSGRARALFAQALETPGGLRIQTIHAFCERLLARFPLEAGVAPGFDIADEARAAALLGQARAEAALAPDAPVEAFRRFAARLHGEALDSLLDRLALRRADFHRYAAQLRGPIFAEAEIRNRHGVRQNCDDFCSAFMARQDWGALREAAAVLAEGSAQDQETAVRLKAVLGCAQRHRDALGACFAFALTGDGDLRKSYVTASTRKAQPWVEPLLRRFAQDCVEARQTLNAIERAEDASAALALALKLDSAYEQAKERAGALDFDDLIEHAQALLRKSEAAPWVLYKLDGGIDHVLIDEGQDTSPMQWDLIGPLQEEFFAGKGQRDRARTMFAVGDPKQSIYAFQGADPRRFLSESQTLSKRAARAKQSFVAPTLETSFRSSPEVLRAVDQVFATRPLIEAAAAKPGEIRHLAHREKEGGVVEVWPLAKRPAVQPAAAWDAPMDVEMGASVHAQLARKIAKRVKDMIEAGEAVWDKDGAGLRALRPGDVLALVRTRGALFRELIKAFKREGLPVAGADRMTLRDELAVEDCLALMRVALDPADDLSLACVLKGPWCDLEDDDADIFPLAYGRERESLMARLMASGDAKYAPAQAFVRELTARAGLDAFAFLSWALETPHGGGAAGWQRVLARLGAEARDPLEELLQRALKPGAHAAATLQRFLNEIEVDAGQVKRELEAETGAVRVMTVHGAKGLEAPFVILPDSTGEATDKPDDGLIFDEDAGPFISFRAKDDDARTAAARAAHEARMLSEHWRLLYVAMTRARDRLIVCGAQFGTSRAGETPESWRAAVEDALRALAAHPCETPFGEGLRLGAPLHASASAPGATMQTGLPAWAKTQASGVRTLAAAAPSRVLHGEQTLFSPRGEGANRFRRGLLIHGLLQRLPEVAPERRAESARTWLVRQGVETKEADTFAGEALRVIGEPRFAAVFSASSRAETPIVGEAAGLAVRGVVDRLVVDAERVIVLDYKTDRPSPRDAASVPESYVLQLALYREVLRGVFPSKPVVCALLWTETPHLMELPAARLDAALEQLRRG